VGEIERPSRDLVRRPRHVIVPLAEGAADDRWAGQRLVEDRQDFFDEEKVNDWSTLKPVLTRHRVTIACVGLIAISLAWKISFLTHFYLRQDDFQIMDFALKTKLSWSFLTRDDAGHLFPGVYAISWVLSRIALYNYAAAAAVTVILIAGASLAAWRLLRTLMGSRPAILIPLALYLLSPLAFPNYSLWITAAEALPLQIALFMSLDAHIHYVWTGKFRHAIAAAAWLLFGLVFFEKAAVIPLLIFAVTAGFLTRRPLLAAIWAALTRLWKAWLLYLALLGAYAAVFLISIHHSKSHVTPSSGHLILSFSSELTRDTLLPGLLGGPWQWFASPTTPPAAYAYASPNSDLVVVSALVVAGIIVASILIRRRAWRAWAILAGWVILADIVPIALGRLQNQSDAAIFGLETRYVADAAAVLAIAVALAFWPVASPEEQTANRTSHRREFFGGPWRTVAVGLVGIITLGSIWSVQHFQTISSPAAAANRSYIATARVALARAPSGIVIDSQLVPSSLMVGAFLADANTGVVLKPLSHRGAGVSWTTDPTGNIENLWTFNTAGQLVPATIFGTASSALSARQGCTSAKSGRLVVTFPTLPGAGTRYLSISYLASSAAAGQLVTVSYGSVTRQLAIAASVASSNTLVRYGHNAYLPVNGSAAQVIIQAPRSAAICVHNVTAGVIVPSGGPAVPATPVAGS
jgi:hypothetical protein